MLQRNSKTTEQRLQENQKKHDQRSFPSLFTPRFFLLQLLMKFLFSLLLLPLAANEIITPASVLLQVGTELYLAANIRNGSGLSAI